MASVHRVLGAAYSIQHLLPAFLSLRTQKLLVHPSIPLPSDRKLLQNPAQLFQLPLAQLHYLTILFHPLRLGRAWDGNRALGAYPADSYLRQCRLFAFRDLADGLNEFEVLGEIFGLEAGKHATEVRRGEVGEGAEGAGEKAAGDGAVSCDGDLNCFVGKRKTARVSFDGLEMNEGGERGLYFFAPSFFFGFC